MIGPHKVYLGLDVAASQCGGEILYVRYRIAARDGAVFSAP